VLFLALAVKYKITGSSIGTSPPRIAAEKRKLCVAEPLKVVKYFQSKPDSTIMIVRRIASRCQNKFLPLKIFSRFSFHL